MPGYVNKREREREREGGGGERVNLILIILHSTFFPERARGACDWIPPSNRVHFVLSSCTLHFQVHHRLTCSRPVTDSS